MSQRITITVSTETYNHIHAEALSRGTSDSSQAAHMLSTYTDLQEAIEELACMTIALQRSKGQTETPYTTSETAARALERFGRAYQHIERMG